MKAARARRPHSMSQPVIDVEEMLALPTMVTEVPSTTVFAHTGGSVTDRQVSSWRPIKASADADLLPDLDELVARARDLSRNSGIAKGGLQTIVDNVVGVGLRLASRPNYTVIPRMTKDAADRLGQAINALWVSYAESTACDAADSLIFDHMTALVLRSQLDNGDACAIPYFIPDRGDGWATKFQVIESDRLSNPKDAFDTLTLRAGVELDKYGGAVAYHVRTTHPGDIMLGNIQASVGEWVRIPKRTGPPFNRIQFIHVFDRTDRAGQTRGSPIFAPVIAEFKNIDRYKGAEIQAALINAMIAGTIETPMEQDAILQLFNNDNERYLKERRDYAVAMESGSLLPLFPGDKVNSFLPSRPSSQFGVFMENVLRFIAVALGMPYELLLKDFTKTTYSSMRAAMIEAWRAFLRRRDLIITQWCDVAYGLWFEEAVHDGKIPISIDQFYEYRAAYLRCRWIGPGRGYADPLKEPQASVYKIQNGLSTREDECAEQGKDWREVQDQLAVERRYIESLQTPAEKAAAAAQNASQTQSAPAGSGPGAGKPKSPAGAAASAVA